MDHRTLLLAALLAAALPGSLIRAGPRRFAVDGGIAVKESDVATPDARHDDGSGGEQVRRPGDQGPGGRQSADLALGVSRVSSCISSTSTSSTASSRARVRHRATRHRPARHRPMCPRRMRRRPVLRRRRVRIRPRILDPSDRVRFEVPNLEAHRGSFAAGIFCCPLRTSMPLLRSRAAVRRLRN